MVVPYKRNYCLGASFGWRFEAQGFLIKQKDTFKVLLKMIFQKPVNIKLEK